MKSRTKLIRSSSRLRRTQVKTAPGPASSRRSATPPPRILVPIDFSHCSRMALQYAVSLARSLKGSLLLLYVAETNPAGSELGSCHLPNLEADLRHMGKHQLAQLRKQGIPAEIVSDSVIRAARSDAEILDVGDWQVLWRSNDRFARA